MTLNQSQIDEYLNEHLPYRLNSLRAWDIYVLRRKAKEYKNEPNRTKCYWEGEQLQPALEVSIVFGRSLLNFLGIKRDGSGLRNFQAHEVKPEDKDTIFIWHVNYGKPAYPTSRINVSDEQHLLNLIKVANKSTAHLTIKTSSESELDSLGYAREIIYRIMLDYVDGLDKSNLWWENK
jgi:hypothetical protein